MVINDVAIYVDCTGTQNSSSAQTRVINFYGCTTTSCTASNATIIAQVTFDDYSANNIDNCSDVSAPGTCGTGMTINSWIVETANS